MKPEAYPIVAQPWLSELLAASGEGIALVNADGRIVCVNERLRELAGEGLDGRPLAALFDDPTWRLGLQAARGRGRWSGRLTLAERVLDVRLRLHRDGFGVLLCQDISERVEQDRRTEALAQQLEEHVDQVDQTRELLFEQSERLTTVYQLTLEALESATVRDSADRICHGLSGDLDAENVALWLVDQDLELIRRIAAVGPRAKALPITVARASAPNLDDALRTGQPVPPTPGGALDGFAVFALPGRERLLGVLTVDHAPDLDRVQVYMPHVATGINNAIMAEELARANLQLRAIDQQKSEFLNVVAHDLRTPLTCIRTYTDLITMYVDEDPATYAEFLSVIAEETERLGELLDNFLDLARIENATLHYELEPVRADEIAAHFLQVYRAKADAEGIALDAVLDGAVPVVRADRRRIEQVFSNLLSNAVKFTPRGGSVSIEVAPAADGVMVAVADTGPGVPAADRQRIFERFRQVGDGHERGGSGLGLAIAKAIVGHHGGRIWVEDGPVGGSRFVFVLPLDPPPDAVAGAPR